MIHNTHVCGFDGKKVRRDISRTNCSPQLMIIAEAMAPEQVRLSGVNYFYSDDKIGSTGKSLERFLNKFQQTVYPNQHNSIYSTEIVHGFPGYVTKNGKRSIRRPSKEEIIQSIKSGILQKEIKVFKPQLILLMGDTAYKSFYNYLLKTKPNNSLSLEIDRISQGGEYFMFNKIPVIPIQHSSGANPRFYSMLNNLQLINKITSILNKSPDPTNNN